MRARLTERTQQLQTGSLSAYDEIASGVRKEGLWLKAIADALGDESLAKALYIRLRAQSMLDDSVREGTRQRVEAERAASEAATRAESERRKKYQEEEQRSVSQAREAKLRADADRPPLEERVFVWFALALVLFAFGCWMLVFAP